MSGREQGMGTGEIIPLGILLVGLVVGGEMVFNDPFTGGMWYLRWVILALCALGVVYVVASFWSVYQSRGADRAVAWLFASSSRRGDGQRSRSSSANASAERTPPVPESTKNELYFERANMACEWCQRRVDSPDVHHIVPRSEKGSNDPTNLIVLCPNCHRKADGGVISQSKLTYRVKQQMNHQEA